MPTALASAPSSLRSIRLRKKRAQLVAALLRVLEHDCAHPDLPGGFDVGHQIIDKYRFCGVKLKGFEQVKKYLWLWLHHFDFTGDHDTAEGIPELVMALQMHIHCQGHV